MRNDSTPAVKTMPKASTAETFQRALVVVAHPDDPEFLFGATIARLAQDGVEIEYVVCSDGTNGSRDVDLAANALRRMRYDEQRAAAAELGVADVTFLDFADGRLIPDYSLRLAIARVIRRVRPELVVTHYPRRVLDLPLEASHPDHVAVGEATLTAVYPDATNARALRELIREGLAPHRVKQVWLAGYERADLVVDATPFVEHKERAILHHRSQLVGEGAPQVPPWVRGMMRLVGQSAGYEFAEGFRRIKL